MADIIASLSPQTAPVHAAVARAAQRSGVSFHYLFNEARVESALNPAARARGSSAAGLFQFLEQSWLATVKAHGHEHGLGWAADAISVAANGRAFISDATARAAVLDLRLDPNAAASMAAALALDNRVALEQATGRAAAPVDLYLAHFLGAAGAVRFLRAHEDNPDQPAAPLFAEAAAANQNVFFNRDGSARSLADIRRHFAEKLGEPVPLMPDGGDWRARGLRMDAMASPLVMARMEPMPGKLSIDFAQAAYARLAQMEGAA